MAATAFVARFTLEIFLCQFILRATKGIPRKINKLAMTALRLAAARKASLVNEAILLDATAEALL